MLLNEVVNTPLIERPIQFWIDMFNRVNQDDPENHVDFSDTEYYTDQIENIFSGTGELITREQAQQIASQLV